MCGIAGFSGSFSKTALSRMGCLIAHRGPDASGEYYSEESGVGLVHTRLSIIDLSQFGNQPMLDPTGQFTIVFNGEIYNYRELRFELEALGYSFRGHSDTEVLLNLYVHCGHTMLGKLNGIFAFAIWDEKTKSLFLARDGLGVKPLYYSTCSKGFVFASELKSILTNPEISRELDPAAILMHLTYLWCPAPSTILANVKKLAPGHAMIVSGGSIQQVWSYYKLPYDQEMLKISAEDAAHLVESRLREAVQRQMVSDVPVGAFLSGGLDSSAVVAIAKSLNPDVRFQCFTIGLEGAGKEGFVDDLPYATHVANHLGVDLHTVHVGSEMFDSFRDMIYHLDEPLADPAPLNVLFISQMARDMGIKVLLSGAGGDDIFSGYRRHVALQFERYWSWMPSPFRSLMSYGSENLFATNHRARRIKKAFEYANLKNDERLVSYFYWAKPQQMLQLMSSKYSEGLNALTVSEPLTLSMADLDPSLPRLNRMLFLESKFFLPDHNLNYTDKMSMAVGVEVRVPLLDLDLVSLAAQLPIEHKQHGIEGKWIFKKAMEKYLPRDVIYRPKTGFGAPLRLWLHDDSKLQPLMRDLLSDSSISRRGIFDPVAVKKLIKQDREGSVDSTYTIFSLMCIEYWCRVFLDSEIKI